MVILTVTSFGATTVTRMVYYRLVEDSSIRSNIKGYDYEILEEKGYGEMFNALAEEAAASSEVEDTMLWYTDMFTVMTDQSVMSEEYWEAYRLIANEYYDVPFTRESFQEYKKNSTMFFFSIVAVEDEIYQQIAKACNANASLSEDRNGVIIYQNIEMSTDNMKFEDFYADHYRFFKLQQSTSLSQGDTFSANFINGKTKQDEEFVYTVDGFATDEQMKDYFTFHGEQPWLITSSSTASKMNEILKSQTDPTADGNEFTLGRVLYIKLKDPESAYGKKLEKLSFDRDSENQVIVASISDGAFGITSIAETINLIIDIVAICFVVFSSFICLLNLFNSVKGRADARKKEMGMLRSLGMEHTQISKMLCFENGYLLMKGVLWSLVISLPMITGIKYVLTDYFGNMKMNFPWKIYVISLIITVFSLLAVSYKCYKYRKNDNILEDLRREDV